MAELELYLRVADAPAWTEQLELPIQSINVHLCNLIVCSLIVGPSNAKFILVTWSSMQEDWRYTLVVSTQEWFHILRHRCPRRN